MFRRGIRPRGYFVLQGMQIFSSASESTDDCDLVLKTLNVFCFAVQSHNITKPV